LATSQFWQIVEPIISYQSPKLQLRNSNRSRRRSFQSVFGTFTELSKQVK
jgi:hypothetical protein